ncbi:hypothetical protein [Paracidovorax wautersii]|uniref:Uncharacterized protein n=1 Tax=Paracidovorax wautersii TaxID=1177982 RepID=A0A1I2GDV6_9BURK|nr:hypothetical protein [Paracidovorax wautersii]SFF15170.1 hypothetical protein SAMN04489711_11494 [Paracidovorax wautersii]
MPSARNTCASCQHWLRHDTAPMNQHGMHPCAHGMRWTYLPPQHSCRQWAKRPAAAQAPTASETQP